MLFLFPLIQTREMPEPDIFLITGKALLTPAGVVQSTGDHQALIIVYMGKG